jgi:hypothetical protein
MNTALNLAQNLDDFEDFYALLDVAHASLDGNQGMVLNAQLVLLLSNHIGDMAILRQAFALAREKVAMTMPGLACRQH